MGDCSPAEYMNRISRNRPYKNIIIVDSDSVAELREKLLKVTNRNYCFASFKTKKWLRAEAGNRSLKEFGA